MAAAQNTLPDPITAEAEFHSAYGSGHDFEGDALIDCVVASGRFMEHIVGAPARTAMCAIIEALGYEAPPEPNTWAQVLADSASGNAHSDWPLGNLFHALNAYAYYGLLLEKVEFGVRETFIRDLIDGAKTFFSEVPPNWNVDLGDARRTYQAAEGRWALDHGERIEPEALALLGKASAKTIRNMLSLNSLSSEGGRIPASEAREWLNRRKEFKSSTWQMSPVANPPQELGRVYFVPVARDGSRFHPGLETGGNFTIGPKGAEQNIGEFEAALEALQHMPVPRWRRPNAQGNRGIVYGTRWERATLDELENG